MKPSASTFRTIFDASNPTSSPSPKTSRSSVPEDLGRGAIEVWKDIVELIVFVGELTVGVLRVALRPGRLRWRDAFLTMELAGANALPIVAMIGFLIGLIASFSGMRTGKGTAGVGIAANTAVVHSMLAVFIGEVFIVQIIDLLRRFL